MNREPFQNGEYYYVYNRGTDKRIIFNNHIDVARFLKSMDVFNSTEPIGSIWLDDLTRYFRIHEAVERMVYLVFQF